MIITQHLPKEEEISPYSNKSVLFTSGGKILLLIFGIFPLVAWGKEYFTAAVFEHRPRDGGSTNPRAVVTNNFKFYEKAAKIGARKGADIIVFNEFGIFPYFEQDARKHLRQFAEYVPDPERTKFNPCVDGKEDMPLLSTLSCMARKNNIYLVANLGDMQPCEGTCSAQVRECDQKCSEDGVFMYNTNVAFDRKGYLIARYHKMRPYFEEYDIPEDPEFVTFSTEFGKFGLFTGFDSIWDSSMILAQDYGIDTVVSPVWLLDDVLPFNSVEWQQSWAIANRVNFLAANAQVPGNGSLGSGIYSRELGALVYSYEPDGESKLLVARVPTAHPKDNSPFSTEASITVIHEHESFLKNENGDLFPEYGFGTAANPVSDVYKDYRNYQTQIGNYTLAKLEQVEGDVEVCNSGFCCKMKYSTYSEEGVVGEEYYFGAFSGHNNISGYYRWCEETCLLLRCDAADGKPCVRQPSRANTVFSFLNITADFTAERVYPTISLSKFRLAPTREWHFNRRGSTAVLKFEPRTADPLLKAGLLGRCYRRDPPFTPFYKS